MPKEEEIYYSSYGIEPVSKNFLRKQEVENLFRKPKKDSFINTPHYQLIEPNHVQEADLLYLPNDNGYKYVLVVVDVGSRLTDAEPLKEKSSETVKNAFKTIYKRGILKMPHKIQTDPGSEFKGEVKKYFEKNDVFIRYGKAGRHRQQALAESRNYVIGRALMKKMTAEELLTNKVSRRWIDTLPTVIRAMNKHYSEQVKKLKRIKVNDTPIAEGDALKLLEVGTKVRVILDESIRWSPEIKVVKQILLKPNKPPMYLVDNKKEPDGVDKVPYTKSQLQVIPKDEEEPRGNIILKDVYEDEEHTWVVKRILDKKKKKGRWYYLIRWKGFGPEDDTLEPIGEIKKFYPDMVKEFEKNSKNN